MAESVLKQKRLMNRSEMKAQRTSMQKRFWDNVIATTVTKHSLSDEKASIIRDVKHDIV